jgi:hypothetical protein
MLILFFAALIQTEPILVVLKTGTVLSCSEFRPIEGEWHVLTLSEGFQAAAPYQEVRRFKIRNSQIDFEKTAARKNTIQSEASERKAIVLDQSAWDQYSKDKPAPAPHLPGEGLARESSPSDDAPSSGKTASHTGPPIYWENHVYERPTSIAEQEALNEMFQREFDRKMEDFRRAEDDLRFYLDNFKTIVVKGTLKIRQGHWSEVVNAQQIYEECQKKISSIVHFAIKSSAKINRTPPPLNEALMREIRQEKLLWNL